MNFEETVDKYVKLRDKRDRIRNEQKAEIAKYDAVLDQLEAAILKVFNETGMESFRTAAGTAYKNARTSATIADWDSFFAFVTGQEAWHMLEKRVSKTAVEAHKSETGDLPPGINWSSTLEVGVRRPTKVKETAVAA